MSIRESIIQFAEIEVGTTESPAGSNKVKYNDWYYESEHVYHKNTNPFAWCGTFIAYIFHFGGFMLPDDIFKSIYYVPKIQNVLEAKGLKVPFKSGKPADIVVFDFNNDKFEEHIGILHHIEGEYAWCIEGNTSKQGHQSNGGMVCLKKRHRSLIEGIYNVIDHE